MSGIALWGLDHRDYEEEDAADPDLFWATRDAYAGFFSPEKCAPVGGIRKGQQRTKG